MTILNPRSRLFLHILFGLALAFGLLAYPRPVAAALGITSVEPGTVSNASGATLVVRGTDFASGAVVVLDGHGALSTSFVSATVLTAVLPPGLPVGTYGITVINPDSVSATLAGALTITGPTATPAPTAFVRPLIVVQSYGASSTAVVSNQDYDFEMTLVNTGQAAATNVLATFETGDFTPRTTGGVRAVGELAPGQTARFFQPLTSGNLSGKVLATLSVLVSYTDKNGTPYTETFTLTFDIYRPPVSGATATPTPTGTARALVRPQLVISGYRTDVALLQPGTHFTLEVDVQNVGSAAARRVTMIIGGGTAGDGGNDGGGSGTPGPGGGISGAGGDFTNFAPVNASNVQFLGDLDRADTLAARQTLIVNTSTKAGAYPMKFSFVYVDEKGVSYTDDQAITLLVYQLPQVDIGFYQETGPLFAGQPGPLPLQVLNLSRSSVVLGNLRVTAPQGGAELANNVSLIGALDVGGFPFTLDAVVIPHQPGPLELLVTVDYTDDFNQPRQITETLTLEVMEAFVEPPPVDGGNGGNGEPPPVEETLLQRLWRFLRGLFGLDSGVQTPAGPSEFPLPGPGEGGPVEGPRG